jgi:deoxyadenosine/deoxycytidine kinase
MMAKRPIYIVVDGIIGAGKSVLSSECLIPELTKLGLKVVEIQEPVEKWKRSGHLQRFYENPSREAFRFQIKVFHDRIQECRKTHLKYGNDADLFILERSIFTDCLFMNMLLADGIIDQSQHDDYMELWAMWSELMPFSPDMFIYLRPSIDTCMSRLRQRNRDGEAGVSMKYQTALMKEHDCFLKGTTVSIDDRQIPLLILNTNANFKDDSKVKLSLATTVLNMMKRIDGI